MLAINDALNTASIYRFLKQENLSSPNLNATDRRAFEATLPNQIWQSDIMHGPYMAVDGQKEEHICVPFSMIIRA